MVDSGSAEGEDVAVAGSVGTRVAARATVGVALETLGCAVTVAGARDGVTTLETGMVAVDERPELIPAGDDATFRLGGAAAHPPKTSTRMRQQPRRRIVNRASAMLLPDGLLFPDPRPRYAQQ